jgi:hypothetical protein
MSPQAMHRPCFWDRAHTTPFHRVSPDFAAGYAAGLDDNARGVPAVPLPEGWSPDGLTGWRLGWHDGHALFLRWRAEPAETASP